LKIGPQTGNQSGLILNGGTIGTSNLNFGSAEALIYASQAGGTISSTIQGSGGLTRFGPGALTLTASNACTGPVNVNSGTLVAASATGSATGSGAVTVQKNATLQVSGVAGGAGGTTLVDGSTLLLSGGTVAGPLTMNTGSYLFGHGTITGPTTISGTIGSSATDPAAAPYTGVEYLKFANTSNNFLSTTYSWRLNALDAAPVDAGTNWSLLDFLTTGTTRGTPSQRFNMTTDFGSSVADPNSGNPFWSQPHKWLVAEAPDGFRGFGYHADSPAFSEGSFSVSHNSQYVYINYTPNLTNGEWATNGSGTWSDTANWIGGKVPGAAQDTAPFGTVLTSGTAIVTFDASRSLSSLGFRQVRGR